MKTIILSLSLSIMLSACLMAKELPTNLTQEERAEAVNLQPVIDFFEIMEENTETAGGVQSSDASTARGLGAGIDIIVEEIFGGMGASFIGTNSGRGNIFRVDSTVNLLEHRFYFLNSSATGLSFFVYEGANMMGTYTLINHVDTTGYVGTGWASTGPIEVVLQTGGWYYIGASWGGNADYYRGNNPCPEPASFGSLERGIASAFPPYPIPQTVNYNYTTNYSPRYQTIVTGTTSPLTLTLTLHNPPIQIPAGGGVIHFDAAINNNSSDPVTFDAWTMVILPNGVSYGPLIQRNNLFAAPGATLMRIVSQNVPGIAPFGSYTYVGNVGLYPDSILDSDSFPFDKLAGDAPPAHNLGWAVSGWDEEPMNMLTTERLIDLTANPNPFNNRSLVSFTLQREGYIELSVYDVNGREIANLAEGMYPAGTHQVPWEASGISSGIYFARLQKGNITKTEKLMLVK